MSSSLLDGTESVDAKAALSGESWCMEEVTRLWLWRGVPLPD